MRAVLIESFSPAPSPGNIALPPWQRLAAFLSAALGRSVEVEDILLRPTEYAQVRSATAVWMMLAGEPADPDRLPHGGLTRNYTSVPHVAFVREQGDL